MNIEEVLIATGIIIFLMLICIVIVFILFTKKTIQNVNQKREFDFKIQQAIIASQESEREELANNLHDDIGPVLSIVSRQLRSGENPGKAITFSAEERISIHDKMDSIIADIRKYSSKIYPTHLKHFGLINSLQQNLFDIRSDIQTQFFDKTDNALKFSNTQELTIYRVVNEILNNIIKHAQATELECELMTEDNQFLLLIMHNGIPFTQEMFLKHASTSKGKGCSSILNRTLQLKGKIEFYRILNLHSCVSLSIPMS